MALGAYPFLRMPEYPNREPSWYAFVVQFIQTKANGVSIDQFVRALVAEGLVEVDRPKSTGPVHCLPLFSTPHLILPRLYGNTIKRVETFENAKAFYGNAIKLPVWAFPEDAAVVQKYIEGFQKVADVVVRQPELLRGI